MENYLKETALLNYKDIKIQNLINSRGWNELKEYEKIREVYNFVRDEIYFGYNEEDSISATNVLEDGYGQCNTKAILLMTILRALKIPCRLHGFNIDSKVQAPIMNRFFTMIGPKSIVHTWVEIYFEEKWISLEGVIIDKKYLKSLQIKFKDVKGEFHGYGVGIKDFQNPPVDWEGVSTYIQKEDIIEDLGIFNDPDSFYLKYHQNLNSLKKFIYVNIARNIMNKNVFNIRNEINLVEKY